MSSNRNNGSVTLSANGWPATTSASATAPTTDLAQSINRETLARRIKNEIDEFCKDHYSDGHRKHLGASLIGRECNRELWYVFRWVKLADHTRERDGVVKDSGGRMMRLFNRGHGTEERFVTWLEGIGCKVSTVDTSLPLKAGQYQQYRVEGATGEHFGGSLDALIEAPEHWGLADRALLGEFKTHNLKSFTKLVKETVKVAKYEHYCQMCVYGAKRGIRFGLYCAINKNDDDLYLEIVELDWALGRRLEEKADKIINSPLPPQRISETPTYSKCAYCDFSGVCHKMEPYEKSCRSCINAQPIANKKWFCHHYKDEIAGEWIEFGCDAWREAR